MVNAFLGAIIVVLVAAWAVLARQLKRERARERQVEADASAAVRDVERRREVLLDLVPDAVLSVDKNGAMLECNVAAERMFGCAGSKLYSKALSDLLRPTPFGPSTPEQVAQFLFAEDELGKRHEMSAVREDGAEFPVELVFNKTRSGSSPTYLGYIREITERIKGETAQFERASLAALSVDVGAALTSHEGLRGVLQRCADAMIWHINVTLARIWVVDEHETLRLEATAGYESELPEDPHVEPPGTGVVRRVVEARQAWLTNDLTGELPSGRERDWAKQAGLTAVAAYPLMSKGRVVGLMAVYDQRALAQTLFTKITSVADGIAQFIERSHAEEQVREQAALLDKANDAILVRDLQGHIRYWNKSAERTFGWTAEEAIGHEHDELLGVTGEITPASAQEETVKAGEWSGELKHVTKDGAEVMIDSRWTLVNDAHGAPKAILVIDTDITEKKQLEEQFLRAQRLEIVGTLAGGVAHDLNNMLGPILNSTQLLRKSVTDERGLKWIGIMESNARRGAELVKQVLTFSRGLGGEWGVLQLKHLIREIERMMQETLPATIQLEVDIPKELKLISGDATQMHQVLLNLCVNARDAMPDGGRIIIHAETVTVGKDRMCENRELKAGDHVLLSVTDTGTGIPPEVRDKIFDPFFTTKEIGKGTGLGLSTVMNIVRGHDAVLDLQSEVGKGTTFAIYFPVADMTETQAAEPVPMQELAGNGELILLVDDESSIREITRATLENFGYRVITGANGKEAVSIFVQRRREIAAVVMDVVMPIMDGPTAMQTLRQFDPEVKLLAISGAQNWEDFAQNKGLGDVRFLSKPFNSEAFLEALHTLLKKGKA